MRRTHLVLLFCALFAGACSKSGANEKTGESSSKESKDDEAPSPEKVCKHIAGLDKDKGKDEDDKDKKIKRCVKKASAKKEEDAKTYACMASCMMKTESMDEVGACDKKCRKSKDKDDDKEKDKGDDEDKKKKPADE